MDSDIKLPALRQSGALAEQNESDYPGAQVLEMLEYLSAEMNKAIEIFREETEESLEGGDASERIQTLNALRLRKRGLETHIKKELKEINDIITSMKLREDKSVIATLTARMKDLIQDLQGQLRQLVDDFGL